MGGDPAPIQAFAAGAVDAIGDSRARRVLGYVLKLTRRPAQMLEDDVQGLRDAGLSDSAVHDVASVTAYFNFVNRLALGLGVELEPDPAAGTPEGPQAA